MQPLLPDKRNLRIRLTTMLALIVVAGGLGLFGYGALFRVAETPARASVPEAAVAR